jgi:hypothetical protein
MFIYHCEDLTAAGYAVFDFQLDRDSQKSTSRYVYTLDGGIISWRSVKQSCIVDSTMEAEYAAACEAAKGAVWLRKFLMDLVVMRVEMSLITLFCNNRGTVAQSKKPRNHRKGKHIECKYHLIREIVS